jgi:hypothetical protein
VQAIYDLESNRMGAGKIALIGDAAFVARPHCGAGVSKAADDAASLADSLGLMTVLTMPLTHFLPSGRPLARRQSNGPRG